MRNIQRITPEKGKTTSKTLKWECAESIQRKLGGLKWNWSRENEESSKRWVHRGNWGWIRRAGVGTSQKHFGSGFNSEDECFEKKNDLIWF